MNADAALPFPAVPAAPAVAPRETAFAPPPPVDLPSGPVARLELLHIEVYRWPPARQRRCISEDLRDLLDAGVQAPVCDEVVFV